MTTEWSNLADLSHFPTTEEERIRQIEHRLEAMEKKYDPLLVMGQRTTMLEKRVDFVVECIGRFFDSVSVFPPRLFGQEEEEEAAEEADDDEEHSSARKHSASWSF
ncbi:hypothetical protein FGLOB1_7856 [Fusarium globosum]|uniref:Uncharacterized protein n=1 Tax=Fusarium globosum TaxID=78864 RepID=A0A8H5Y4R0_9HYPO|nr:hypothetical protein FGLOB1_7856 [Fusarium globosum]